MTERTLAELMTWNIVTIDQGASLARATEVMETARISSVLVTEFGRPVGIVTERDVLRALEAKLPHHQAVATVMGKPLVCAPKDMSVHDAYHFMAKKGVRHLLVTDAAGNPAGIVSESDFRFHLGLEFYRRLQDVRTVMSSRVPVLSPAALVREAISAMAARDANCAVVAVDGKPVGMITERDAVRFYREGDDTLDLTVADVMSKPVATIPVGTHLHDAMERMQSQHIRHLVVVGEAGEVAGILSEHDVVRQLESEYLDFALKDSRRTRRQLRESEMRRNAVFNQARQLMGILDLDGTLRDANRSALELIGDPDVEEVIGKPFWNTPWWSHDPVLQERLRLAFAEVASGRPSRFEATHPAADGTLHYVDFQLHPILDDSGKLAMAMAEGSDITERHRIEEQRRLALRVFQSSHDGIMITDPAGVILDVNQAFCDLTGYSREEAVGQSSRLLDSGHHDKAFFQQMFDTIAREDHWLGEIWNRTKAGGISVVLMTISAVRDTAGELTHYVGVFTDITRKKESERRLEHLAHHDALTDLPNRSLFRDRLHQAIRKADRDGQALALLFIDLDRFKEVNDSLGHVAGDRLLVEAARRIAACVRNSDTVARLGGDEFTVVLQDVEDGDSAAGIAREVIDALAAPFDLGQEMVSLSASIGIALCPDDAEDPDALTDAADQAMYDAKALGRNRYSFYAGPERAI
ncbi:MAG: diguanylate cyclase [Rhodocyclales bacterium]|nr:diguanylate cyclase [Rhodocyclales bacterium]